MQYKIIENSSISDHQQGLQLEWLIFRLMATINAINNSSIEYLSIKMRHMMASQHNLMARCMLRGTFECTIFMLCQTKQECVNFIVKSCLIFHSYLVSSERNFNKLINVFQIKTYIFESMMNIHKPECEFLSQIHNIH